MLNLKELKSRRDLLDSIDWYMTPEEAVRLYLEWGNNWASGNYVIRSKSDISLYFVINTWKNEPLVYLIQRNEEEAKELAKIELPEKVVSEYFKRNGRLKGVFSLDTEIKLWLRTQLNI